MPTRNVVLTDRQSEFIAKLVSSGSYQNASEVLREGIRLVERQEPEVRLELLREAAKTGIADIESGRFQSFNAPESLRRHLDALAAATVGGPRRPQRPVMASLNFLLRREAKRCERPPGQGATRRTRTTRSDPASNTPTRPNRFFRNH